MSRVSYAKYGKDNVRLFKVIRNPDGTQDVAEYTVTTMLEGDIETSYTKADNSVIVPTDTQKQTAYIIAKQTPIFPPELYAANLAAHFLERYAHIHVARVTVVQHRWSRMNVQGKPHPHSFQRDGEDTRVVEVIARRHPTLSFTVHSAMKGLLVLKSTGSAFYGYDTSDEYTILPETKDRILSTEVDAQWMWKAYSSIDAVRKAAEAKEFDVAFDAARRITIERFALEESPSVQNTMFLMADEILKEVPGVEEVEYTLPNKHYFEINLSWFDGLKNTGADAEVYAPQSDPNGLINCKVTRS